MLKVKLNHTGKCGEFTFVKDQEIELPESVVAALSKDSYILLGETEEQPESNEEVKQVKKSKNKMVKESPNK